MGERVKVPAVPAELLAARVVEAAANLRAAIEAAVAAGLEVGMEHHQRLELNRPAPTPTFAIRVSKPLAAEL